MIIISSAAEVIAVDGETWVIEVGDRVIQRKASVGFDRLTDWERLVYSLWVADYGIRNAGDLDTARDVFPEFQSVGLRAADTLALPVTREAFALAPQALAERYFDLFDAICAEVQDAEPGAAPDTTARTGSGRP